MYGNKKGFLTRGNIFREINYNEYNGKSNKKQDWDEKNYGQENRILCDGYLWL